MIAAAAAEAAVAVCRQRAWLVGLQLRAACFYSRPLVGLQLPAARGYSSSAAEFHESEQGRPPQVVPFQIGEQEAHRRLLAWQSGTARLGPSSLLPPKGGGWHMRPALLPFWMFDVRARLEYAGSVGTADRPPAQQQPPPPEPPPSGVQQQPAAADAADIRQLQHRLGVLSTAKHASFTAAQVAAACQLVERRKSVAGSLPPWFLKAATAELAAQFNAWVRVSQLPASVALSLVDPIPKPGAAAGSLDGLHGIAEFRKAHDSVPRQQLWDKLVASGLGGSWLRAVQALSADVPVAGCPLSLTLFGPYIDNLEAAMLAAAQRGAQLDLPRLRSSGGMVPPLLYADDTTLLATSADGLQRQLDLLQQCCELWRLTLNAAKTKLELLSGRRTQQAALSLAGQLLEAVGSFGYLGITF
ncbi:hypothetical protein D9Q98_004018 [Chlorella vulgaris]|uniref:Reverse transcriptase domain-containing protein n=1 Tax=Chlorella vulgaris TaxID=3077 RepID=A0A9D4TR43_CHLVU|nr:hypothetical protein D9Q98_004018 [Chlorella vulgaris]